MTDMHDIGNPPDGQVYQHLALLLRGPSPGVKNVVESHSAVYAEAIGDSFHTIGAKSASAITHVSKVQEEHA